MSEFEKSIEILKKYMYLVDVKAIKTIAVINTQVFIIVGVFLKSISVALLGIVCVPVLILAIIAKRISSAHKKDVRDEKTK